MLCQEDQEIIRLRFQEGLSAEAIARKLEITVEAVWKRQERTLSRLRRLLASSAPSHGTA